MGPLRAHDALGAPDVQLGGGFIQPVTVQRGFQPGLGWIVGLSARDFVRVLF